MGHSKYINNAIKIKKKQVLNETQNPARIEKSSQSIHVNDYYMSLRKYKFPENVIKIIDKYLPISLLNKKVYFDIYDKLRYYGFNETTITIIDNYLPYSLIYKTPRELQDDQFLGLRMFGFPKNVVDIIQKYAENSLYDHQYKNFKKLYLQFKQVLDNYKLYNIVVKIKGKQIATKPTEIDSVKYLIHRIPQLFIESRARATLCIKDLGIYSLPPSIILLDYLKNIISNKKITHIIDYGAGVGLWASIIFRYLRKDFPQVNVIAYDNITPTKNPIVNFQIPYYNVQDTINMHEYPKSSIMFLLFPESDVGDMCTKALNEFKGDYLVFQGDSILMDETLFFHKLNKKWAILKLFDTIARLSTLESKCISGIYVLQRRKIKK